MDLVGRLLPKLQAKERKRGYKGLSQLERTVVDVMGVEDEVMNGGLHQFFFNSAGDRVSQSIAALREIGAATTAAIVEEACARFPEGKPTANRIARQKQLDKLAFETFWDLDKRFISYPDRVVELLAAYWLKHGGPTD